MEKNHLISIIIPVFNRQNCLERTLSSLTAQTLRPLEIVLVDNASTDKSLDICNKFLKENKDDNLSIKILSEPKPGANAARNTGINASEGEYLFFFDSDDYLFPDSMATIFENLYRNCFPDAIAFPFFLRFPDFHTVKRPHKFTSDPACQLFDTVLSTHCFCLKRSFLSKTGLWDEDLKRWQDLEFGFRVMLNLDKLIWIKSLPLYEVQIHNKSISGNSYTEDHKCLSLSLKKISQEINSLNPGKFKIHLQKALSYRICSLAAQLKRENSTILGKKYLSEAIESLPAGSRTINKIIIKSHYVYTGLGGRGFWRIAEKAM